MGAILNPAGQIVSTEKREIRVTDPRVVRVAANVDEVFRQMDLTVVCVRCGSGFKGNNHPSDSTFVMECECTIRRLVNPTGVQ